MASDLGWPSASANTIEIDNPAWRAWDDETVPRRVVVRQTIPAPIATHPVPHLRSASPRLRVARAALEALTVTSAATHLRALGHLNAVLLRADALASSRIEQIHTSSEALAVSLSDIDDTGDILNVVDAEAALVGRNVAAVETMALHGSDPLTVHDLLDVHRTLLQTGSDLPAHLIGAWRDGPVWIGRHRGVADFEGPPYQQVPALMDDLISFMNRHDLDPILAAAIGHAQLELIHPFGDGNGRVGRALIHRALGPRDTPIPIAYGLLNRVADYISGLGAYSRGKLDSWTETFALAVADAAQAAKTLILRLESLHGHFHTLVPVRVGSTTERLLGDLIGDPVITLGQITDRYGVTTGRASQITAQLTGAGIIRPATVPTPGRHKVWVASEVIRSIDQITSIIPPQPSALDG